MKVPVATIIVLVSFISLCEAQNAMPSLLRVNDNKPLATMKTANMQAYEMKLNNTMGSLHFNSYEKFTLHPVAVHHLIPYPNLTFFKGALPIKSGNLHFSQGVQLDKHNFVYFNLGF